MINSIYIDEELETDFRSDLKLWLMYLFAIFSICAQKNSLKKV